jgi:hypothetical protein
MESSDRGDGEGAHRQKLEDAVGRTEADLDAEARKRPRVAGGLLAGDGAGGARRPSPDPWLRSARGVEDGGELLAAQPLL